MIGVPDLLAGGLAGVDICPDCFWGRGFCSFERLSRREGNGLDLVSIQISEKGAAIVGIVVFTYTGRAFVNRTISNGAFIELEFA